MAGWQPMLESVVRERYPRLVAYASFLTASRAEAEDLVQDAIVATFAGRARISSLAEAESYLRRSVASRWVDRSRRRRIERSALARAAAREPGVVPPAEPAGVAPDLQRALAALAPKVRACVVLRHLDDQSVRETASALGLSEGAVKRYTSDGVRALAVALGVDAATESVLLDGGGERDA